MESSIDPRKVLAMVAKRARIGAICLLAVAGAAMVAVILLAPVPTRARELLRPIAGLVIGFVLPATTVLILAGGIERGRRQAIVASIATMATMATLFAAYAAYQIFAAAEIHEVRLFAALGGFLLSSMLGVQLSGARAASHQLRKLRALTFAALVGPIDEPMPGNDRRSAGPMAKAKSA